MKTRAFTALVFVAWTIAAADPAAAGQARTDEPRLIVRIESASPSSVAADLDARGYDVIRVDTGGAAIDLAVTRTEWRTLERLGYAGTVLDRTRPLRESLQLTSPKTGSTSTALAAPGSTAALGLAASPTNYQDLDGLLARMQEIAAAYPAIVRMVDITATYNTPPTAEGRHMFALKISDNVDEDEDEPAMLIVSTHHAREISTPLIPLGAAERLTSGYQVDPRITAAVDGHEIWVAPLWNPDGYTYVFTTDNMWRKNRRVFSNGRGVDQNRNYPQAWGTSCGGSTSVASETYRGPSAGSEAETQTMVTWSERERFAKVIDYHSYGREVLYGYRCLNHPFTAWMEQEAVALSRASGYGGLTREPSAEGEHQQFQFGRLGAYAFLVETHTEFQPTYASAVAEADLVWPGILTVIERSIPVSGHVTDAVTGAPLSARIELLNVAFSQGETNSSGGAYGAYHMFVPPGTYTVRFSAPGYTPVTATVTATAASAAVWDVSMSPAPPEPPAPVEETVFFDDFEANRGWITNPAATDTATTGRWERGDPQSTSSAGTKQLGTAASGVNTLVTGRLAGASAGDYDLDSGRSSIQSPAIVLPESGTLVLTFRYYLAHGSNSSSADYLRVAVAGATTATVLEELGAATNDDAAWATATVDVSAFAGQTIRIRIEAADAGTASLVEAGIDDVKVVVRR